MADARAIAEETARTSYGRLLAWLASRTGDISAAEDALAEAFRAALEHWPRTGAPASPEAWLSTTARRKLIDQNRRAKTRQDAVSHIIVAAEEAQARIREEAQFPDERLKLLFICAHPAIDESMHTPLMLQTVLGLDAAKIASAFLTSPKAMSARLVRIKRKIKTAGIPFEEPVEDQLPKRMNAVLDAIYAAYGAGWNAVDDEKNGGELTCEAIYLAKLLTGLAPNEPEAWGLLSLMSHAEARRTARLVNGAYIPLDKQDTSLWNKDLLALAEKSLAAAWRLNNVGRYQLEAAIQSAHAASRLSDRNVKNDILLLYGTLLKCAPSIGAQIGYAAALSRAGRHDEALKNLDPIPSPYVETHQPYWAVRAHILNKLGNTKLANEAYDLAIGLTGDAAARTFLQKKKTAQERLLAPSDDYKQF